jgi:hypothetical protein
MRVSKRTEEEQKSWRLSVSRISSPGSRLLFPKEGINPADSRHNSAVKKVQYPTVVA